MARWCVTWFLCGLLLVVLAVGGLSCKEEKGGTLQGEAVQEEMAAPETEEPVETETSKDTTFFEEEEGVQQEDELRLDY